MGFTFKNIPQQDASVVNSGNLKHCGNSGQTMFAKIRKWEVMPMLSKVSPALMDDFFLERLESFVHAI